jgi:hypothetical protein
MKLSYTEYEAQDRVELREINMKIFVAMVLILLLTACATKDYNFDVYTLKQTGVKPVKVKLEIDGGELKPAKEANSKCTQVVEKFRKGCFIADVGEMVEVEFKLQQPGGMVKWRFTKLWICSGSEKPDGGNPCSLDNDQRADWAVLANNDVAWPTKEGEIILTQFSSELREFHLRDYNWLANDYFYQIRACPENHTDEADCVDMDPGSVNKGRGR